MVDIGDIDETLEESELLRGIEVSGVKLCFASGVVVCFLLVDIVGSGGRLEFSEIEVYGEFIVSTGEGPASKAALVSRTGVFSVLDGGPIITRFVDVSDCFWSFLSLL